MTRVALVKTQDRAAGIPLAPDLLRTGPLPGKHAFLKPDFNSGAPPPGSTHDDTLAAMACWLKRQGAERIRAGRPPLEAGAPVGLGNPAVRLVGTARRREYAARRGKSYLPFSTETGRVNGWGARPLRHGSPDQEVTG